MYRIIELPFYEGEPLYKVKEWLQHYRFAIIPELPNDVLNSKNADFLLQCIREKFPQGYAGKIIDGISFQRRLNFFNSETERIFPGDVDLYLDIRNRYENILMDSEGYRNSGSPHFDTFQVPLNKGNEIWCTAVIFHTTKAREMCYTMRHPDFGLEIISRTYYT